MPLKSVSCHAFGEQIKHLEESNQNDSDFTVITEQKATEAKASGNPHTRLDKDTHTRTADVHKPSAQTITPVTQRSAKEGEIDLNKKGATARTAVTSSNGDGDNVTSSDQERAGGTLMNFDCHLFTKTACC